MAINLKIVSYTTSSLKVLIVALQMLGLFLGSFFQWRSNIMTRLLTSLLIPSSGIALSGSLPG